ncbi:hypothetical protein Salat_2576900 [Sesamum alatum]|uniref:Uncharacterized protein n=1 Tax=Sesamum alatum TaxID=300844 RepID=A0AAE1XMI1_9LAMI|nr:hypothetical protein Salat_2576900 [Sesamum alatum]
MAQSVPQAFILLGRQIAQEIPTQILELVALDSTTCLTLFLLLTPVVDTDFALSLSVPSITTNNTMPPEEVRQSIATRQDASKPLPDSLSGKPTNVGKKKQDRVSRSNVELKEVGRGTEPKVCRIGADWFFNCLALSFGI